jgi:hypothetical protein
MNGTSSSAQVTPSVNLPFIAKGARIADALLLLELREG